MLAMLGSVAEQGGIEPLVLYNLGIEGVPFSYVGDAYNTGSYIFWDDEYFNTTGSVDLSEYNFLDIDLMVTGSDGGVKNGQVCVNDWGRNEIGTFGGKSNVRQIKTIDISSINTVKLFFQGHSSSGQTAMNIYKIIARAE